MTENRNSDTPNESGKHLDAKHEREIVELKQGQPKWKEYWEMVKTELEQLRST